MTGHTPCCSSTKYAVLNTVNNSWTDDLQQQKVCDHILEVSETSKGTTIYDTIIVSHSMGGLMVAGAIANKKCSLDRSTTWVSMGSPMTGSMASNYFQKSWMDQTNLFMEKFVETTGFCPADDGIKSLSYEHGSYSTHKLDEAYEAAQEAYRTNVYAVMCSNSFSGIHKSKKNDSMVEFHSCAGGIPRAKFGNDYGRGVDLHEHYSSSEKSNAASGFLASSKGICSPVKNDFPIDVTKLGVATLLHSFSMLPLIFGARIGM